MYHCTVRYFFTGCPQEVVDLLAAVPPLAGFTHVLCGEAADADVVVAGPELAPPELVGPALEALAAGLAAGASPEPRLLVLAAPDAALPPAVLEGAADVWRLPLDAAGLRFHFTRWQERLKLEKDLWQTDQFLECLMATSPNMIWFKDRDGIHERVNATFCRTAGKPRHEVEGRGHAFIWDVAADDPACVESERVVMESGGTHVSEEAVETGAGRRLLTVYKSPLRDVDGSMMGTMGVGVDVTQERHYRERLIQNNAALAALFTSMDCGILCHTLDGGRVISINPAALELLDFASREELQSEGFQMIASTVAEEDKPKLRAAIGQLKNVGDSASYEYRVVHRDGREVHIMGSARLVEQDGEVVCQRFLLDCTEQKLAEEREQREKERGQRKLVRALSVDYQLVCVLDAGSDEGVVLQLKDAPDGRLERIFTADGPFPEKVEAYIDTCVHPDDRERFRRDCTPEALRATLAGRETTYFNYRALNGESVLYFQLKAVRVGAPGEPFGVVVGLQSVDARTRHEMEQKSRLAEALKQAERANRAKSLFLSNMSHDIRTPMNAVVGYTSLALAHLTHTAQVEDYLQKILASGNHLISLINDILDMSHIESGKIRLEEKPHEIGDILREIWHIVQPTASARDQTLSLEVEELRDGRVLCDRLRLKQILLNLLSNSVKYTGRGGAIDMRVRQRECDTPGRAAYEFRIRDNGIGMSEEFLARIFEPFERAQTSTVAGTEGTGLGMAITRNLVEMMQGDIEVKSSLGVGTEFVFRVTFRLPEVPEAPEAPEAPGAPGAPEVAKGADAAVAPGAPRDARLLLAEDNPMNREIALEFLTDAGYSVDVAVNGREAVDMLTAAPAGTYDAVLMDVQMPVLDGYGATRAIRALADPALARVPIIAMTANSFEEDRQEALAHGMNGHIAKPIDFKLLFATLERLLG